MARESNASPIRRRPVRSTVGYQLCEGAPEGIGEAAAPAECAKRLVGMLHGQGSHAGLTRAAAKGASTEAEKLRFAYDEPPLLLNLSVVVEGPSLNRSLSLNLSAPPLAPLGGGTLLSIRGEHLLGLANNFSASNASVASALSFASA